MLEDSFTGQKAGWFGCKAGIPILHHIHLAPFLFCFIFTEMSQSCWPRPPTRLLSVTLCQLFAAWIPTITGRQEAGPVPGKCIPDAGRGCLWLCVVSVRNDLWSWGGALCALCHSASCLCCSLPNSSGSFLSSPCAADVFQNKRSSWQDCPASALSTSSLLIWKPLLLRAWTEKRPGSSSER